MTARTWLFLLCFMSIFATNIMADEFFYLKQERVQLAGSPLEIQLQASNFPIDLHIYRIHKPQDFLLQQTLLRKMQIEGTKFRAELNQALQSSTVANKPPVIGEVAQLPVEQLNFSYVASKQVTELGTPGTDGYSSISVEAIKEPGLYLVEADHQYSVAYNLSLISDLAMITRRTTNDLLVYTVHRQTGQPYPETTVVAYSQGKAIATGITNGDGLLKLDLPYQPQINILAYQGNHFTSDDPRFFPNLISGIKGYIFTERPLYLPGETVYFKGVLRELNRGGYVIPNLSSLEVSYLVLDGRKEQVYEGKSELNPQAAWEGKFELPKSAALGQFTLIATWNNRKFQSEFQVQQFTKPQLQVMVKAKKNALVSGEPAQFDILGKYFAGGVIDAGVVQYQVYRSQFEQPLFEKVGLEGFYSANEYRSFKSDMIASGQLEMKDGKASLEFNTEASDISFSYRVQCTVTDASRNAGVGSASVKAMPAAIRMELDTNKQLYNLEESIQITVKAVDLQNQPVAADFEIDVIRKPRELLSGGSQPDTPAPDTQVAVERIILLKGRTGNDGRAVIEAPAALAGEIQLLLVAKDQQGRKVHAEKTVWASRGMEPVPYSGNAIQIILDKEAYAIGETAQALILLPTSNIAPLITLEGSKLLQYEVRRFTNNSWMTTIPVQDTMVPNIYLRVSAIVENGFIEAIHNIVIPPVNKLITLNITPDQESYAPRQIAKLTIQAIDSQGKPVETDLSLAVVDTALFALASDNNAALPLFFYPLQRKNVSISSSIQQLSYDHAKPSERLLVYWQELASKQSPEASRLGAGNRFQFHLNGDGHDRPAEHAVDSTMPPMASTEPPVGLPVLPAPSPSADAPTINGPEGYMGHGGVAESRVSGDVADLAAGVPVTGTQNETMVEDGKKMKENADGDSVGDTMLERSLFQTTAAWFAFVHTNAQGFATVEVTWPDNLTDWRITAKAIDSKTRVGEIQVNTATRRDVYVAANQPVYLIQRDLLQWEVSATNTSEKMQTLRMVSQTSPELELRSINQWEQNVEPGRILRGSTMLAAVQPGQASLSAQVFNRNRTLDAVKQPVLIRTHGILQSQGASGIIRQESTEITKLNLPAKASNPKLTVRVFPSYYQVVQDSLTMLVAYPYGCTEQTMSRFMPNLVAKQVLQLELAQGEQAEMNKNIKAGLQRLYELQHKDGGWGWWQEDESTSWMTVYVVLGLIHAKSLQFDVADPILQKASEWMLAKAQDKNLEYAERAYLLYALNAMQKSQLSIAEELFDTQQRLQADPYTVATLALLFHYHQRPEEAKALVLQLEKMAKVSEQKDMMYWGEQNEYRWHTNAVGVTAYVVRALAMIDSNHPCIVPGLEWLMAQRHATGWNSTKDTAEVVYTLCTYLRGTSKNTTGGIIKIQTAGAEGELKVEKDTAVWNAPTSALQTGNIPVTLRLDTLTKGLTYTASLEYFMDDDLILASNNDLKIAREYYLLQETKDESQPGVLFYDTKLVPEFIADKELLMVKLTFTLPQAYDYVMIEDPLPATAQVVQEDRNIALHNEISQQKYTHREFQHHQALFFYRHLEAGTYTACYYFRTSFAGTFHALPSQLSLMYYPEIRANGAEVRMNVK